MLIVLEAREAESVEGQASSSHRLVAALRDQLLITDEPKPHLRWFERWWTDFRPDNRTATLVIVTILLILSLTFGLESALQISQAEVSGGSIYEVIGSLFSAQGSGESGAGRETPTPERSVGSYGSDFTWPDRFNKVEVQRETASSKVLWPISTLISGLTLAAWLLPRSDR